MTPTLQLLQKSELPAGNWHVINPPQDWAQLDLLPSAAVSSDEWAVARTLEACEFGLLPSVKAEAEHVLLFLPKAKPRFAQLLKSVTAQLPKAAELWVVGENSGGIKSASKHLAPYFAELSKVGNAKRCGLLRCASLQAVEPELETISAEAEWIAFQDWQLASLPGLFNKGAVDKGTELLLKHLPKKLYGKVLDMGCGGGVLSVAAMSLGAESVVAVDSSAIALEATRQSLKKNNVEGVEVLASDVFSDVPRDIGGSFNWVISNPPFHTGVTTDYQPVQKLIKDSKRYVKSGGRLMFVANRHLPYEQWLEATFKRWELLEQQHGFKVLVAYQ